eukprot:SAG31_NODE_197_length_20660_cov_8.861368_2_plen_83_part_00
MVVKTQYSCCICQETRVKFACKFGFVVPMLFSIMIAMGACWFGALMIEIHSLYDESIFFVVRAHTIWPLLPPSENETHGAAL